MQETSPTIITGRKREKKEPIWYTLITGSHLFGFCVIVLVWSILVSNDIKCPERPSLYQNNICHISSFSRSFCDSGKKANIKKERWNKEKGRTRQWTRNVAYRKLFKSPPTPWTTHLPYLTSLLYSLHIQQWFQSILLCMARAFLFFTSYILLFFFTFSLTTSLLSFILWLCRSFGLGEICKRICFMRPTLYIVP